MRFDPCFLSELLYELVDFFLLFLRQQLSHEPVLDLGKFRLAREILLQELEGLDKTAQQDESTALPPEVQIAPIAQLIVKSPTSGRLDPSR